MPFPNTSDTLKAAGYVYDNEAFCRGCGDMIEWWITPKGKKLPMTVKKAGDPLKTNAEIREPHWASCPNASDFRK